MKKVMLPETIRFFDREGKHVKTLENKKVKKIKDSYMVVLSEMKHLKRIQTQMQYAKLEKP